MGAWKRLITSNDFTDTQIESLQDLVYTGPTVTLSVDPSQFEKGTSPTIDFDFTAVANDDTFVSSTITGEEGDQGTSGTSQVTEEQTSNVSKTFQAIFSNATKTSTKTSYARKPQFYGVSATENFHNESYSTLESSFTKVVQSSGELPSGTGQILFSPSTQYVYFISNTSGLVVKDSNGFPQTDWTETTISIKLANGDTQTNMYQYRTDGTKTLTNFGYELG